MNNKQLGTAFEQRMCSILKSKGYWVHFFAPDNRGAQPCDLIYVKNGIAHIADCKTLSEKQSTFYISRMEDNQIFAFDLWMKRGNTVPIVFIEHGNEIKAVRWTELKAKGKIKL